MRKTAFFAALVLAGTMVGGAFAAPLEVKAEKPFEPEGKPLEGLVITIDAGHGGSAHQAGYSGSARGVNSNVIEGDLNMRVAAELRWHLVNAGAKVYMTRWDDRRVTLNPEQGEATNRAQELGARTQVAADTKSHLFIACHHNSSPPAADGVVILNWPKDKAGEDQPLETALAESLREEVEKTVHHGKRFDFYQVDHPLVSFTDIPSCVIEFGFISNPDFDAWVNTPGAHCQEAIGAYNGVVKFWQAHRAEAEALRLKNFPDAKPVEAKPAPDPAGDVAKSLWPAGTAPKTAADAQYIIRQYKANVLSDSRSFWLQARVERAPDPRSSFDKVFGMGDEPGWMVTGSASNSQVAKGLVSVLEASGFKPLENHFDMLPAAKLEKNIFGVVQIPMALTWGSPKEGDNVQTQLLLGESLFLLDRSEDGDFYLVQGADSYTGWVRREAVLPMDEATFRDWTNRPTARIVRDTMIDDFRLPTAALLPIESVSGSTAKLTLPRPVRITKDSRTVTVPVANLRLPATKAPGLVAAETAVTYLNTPYVFGGRSYLGVDCSGLISASYPTAGFIPARDANQQVIAGRLIATEKARGELQPGDVVYFLDDTGRVYHTGISLGGQRFIHSSPPHVQVSSFDPKDPLYAAGWAAQFAFARRPLE